MAMDWYHKKANPSGLAIKSRLYRDVRFFLVIVISSVLAVWGGDLYRTHASAGLENGLRLIGERVMSESELRDVVNSNHLNVYWAGPSQGSNYLLDTSQANVTVLTILPPGQRSKDTRSSYPQIATYVQKSAFRIVLNGGKNTDVSGFINADGNSVFYTSLDPKNAFVGIRDRDIEVQIFDPAQGASLAIATTAGRLVPITEATG